MCFSDIYELKVNMTIRKHNIAVSSDVFFDYAELIIILSYRILISEFNFYLFFIVLIPVIIL